MEANSKFRCKLPAQPCINGSSKDHDIADCFATHLGSVYYRSDLDSTARHDFESCYSERFSGMCNEDNYVYACNGITVEVIDKCMRDLKLGKAAGPDRITAEHLKYAHPALTVHLKMLFHMILCHSYVPSACGKGTIVPLLKDKSGDVNNPDNYRAITLTPIISKLLESVILNVCESNLQTDDLQFGFKKKHGCADAIFTVKNITDYFNCHDSTVYAAALDISKACDRVSHYKPVHQPCTSRFT
jgi:hypothetical protein